MDYNLISCFLLVSVKGEVVCLLYRLGAGGLVEVKVNVVESAACVNEHVPLLVP